MTVETALIVFAAQTAALSAIMSVGWFIERRTGNSGYIDAVWTFGVALCGAASAWWPLGGEPGTPARQFLIAVMILIWGARLGLHLIKRSSGRADDPRYAEMKRAWGESAGREMFKLVQIQALVAVPLTFAVFCAAHHPAPALSAQDAFAVAIFIAALWGESVADSQLQAFIAAPQNRGLICNTGLWRHSRHPNYFFEWLHWTAYPVAALPLTQDWPVGYFALLAPVVMYWLLVHVSGVPPLEQHMLRRHGDRYRAYQARTNAFFLGPVKHV